MGRGGELLLFGFEVEISCHHELCLLSVQQGKEVEMKRRRIGSSLVLSSSKLALRTVLFGCPTSWLSHQICSSFRCYTHLHAPVYTWLYVRFLA